MNLCLIADLCYRGGQGRVAKQCNYTIPLQGDYIKGAFRYLKMGSAIAAFLLPVHWYLICDQPRAKDAPEYGDSYYSRAIIKGDNRNFMKNNENFMSN